MAKKYSLIKSITRKNVSEKKKDISVKPKDALLDSKLKIITIFKIY